MTLIAIITIVIIGIAFVLLTRPFRDHHHAGLPSWKRGQRVRVSPDYHWAKSATGVIDRPPRPVKKLSRDWSGCSRFVKAGEGFIEFYWVKFDVPQRDAEGDGPFDGGEIDTRFIEIDDTAAE
jgi:hypothetical protein